MRGSSTGGASELYGYCGDDIIEAVAGGGAIFADGGEGSDTITGGDGVDTIGNGADIIDSGTGDDNISGNADADLFKFAVGDGFDLINDFVQADADKLVISTALAAGFAAFQAAGSTVSGSAVYTFSGGTQTITITGFDYATLTAADVVFF